MSQHIPFTLLHCSADLRAEMSAFGRLALHEERGQIDDHWYAHLLLIERRKCVLFTHARTLYSCLAIAQSTARIATLKSLFYSTLQQALQAERLNSEQRELLMQHWQAFAYARSSDKRIVGSMNDLARLFRFEISRSGLLNCPIDRITYDINRSHFSAIDSDPASAFSQRFGLGLSKLRWEEREAELQRQASRA